MYGWPTRRGSDAPNAVLRPDEAEAIRQRYREVGNVSQVARETGFNRETVRRVVRGYTYQDDEG
ncbi:MAG TPA: hypothetical protein VIM84_14400 [Gemmatimonadales bacterium]